jgi:SAM-dependent methyltransferase
VEFSLGYLEDAAKFEAESFDLVWNRLCWYYCMNDAGFARIIYRLLRPGGCAWIHSPQFPLHTAKDRALTAINRITGIKIGHPCPPIGRIGALFRSLHGAVVTEEILPNGDETIVVKRSGAATPSTNGVTHSCPPKGT